VNKIAESNAANAFYLGRGNRFLEILPGELAGPVQTGGIHEGAVYRGYG